MCKAKHQFSSEFRKVAESFSANDRSIKYGTGLGWSSQNAPIYCARVNLKLVSQVSIMAFRVVAR